MSTVIQSLGYQQITSLSSAVGLTVPAGARLALIQAEDQAVRWRDDGTNPTATVGMEIASGETLSYNGFHDNIKFIEGASSAKLNVTFYS